MYSYAFTLADSWVAVLLVTSYLYHYPTMHNLLNSKPHVAWKSEGEEPQHPWLIFSNLHYMYNNIHQNHDYVKLIKLSTISLQLVLLN